MSSNIDLNSIVQRLDRIEQKLTRASVLDDLLNPVDPPPDDWGRIRPELLGMRLIDLIKKFRIPKGDPPPFDTVRFQGNILQDRLAEVLQRNPGWFYRSASGRLSERSRFGFNSSLPRRVY